MGTGKTGYNRTRDDSTRTRPDWQTREIRTQSGAAVRVRVKSGYRVHPLSSDLHTISIQTSIDGKVYLNGSIHRYMIKMAAIRPWHILIHFQM